jgi:ABC-type nitrate/sulfonate/bicarbonate transport system ATPase subunit
MSELPLWSFPAAQEITEVREWRTDVLTSRESEQRIALRPRPREIVTFRHRLDALGMACAAELVRAGFAGGWQVPLWHMALKPDADLVQGATEILLDTGTSDFRSGELAVLAVDGREAATVAIASVQPDRLLLAAPLVLQLLSPAVAALRFTVAPIRADILVQDGEFIVLVGPSGCGKSTLLRSIAGLESVSSGAIRIGGRDVTDLEPRDRDIAMVFQSYALYPHMTVRDNMAFSLVLQKAPEAEVKARVGEAARILGIEMLLDRKPRELSGGQRQRVAMGRAIVRHPQVFLFDEPLSNLDAKLRVQMRSEIRALHDRLGATSIYVTHDQVEAMTMADRIVVLDQGGIVQIGAPLARVPTNRSRWPWQLTHSAGIRARWMAPGQMRPPPRQEPAPSIIPSCERRRAQTPKRPVPGLARRRGAEVG